MVSRSKKNRPGAKKTRSFAGVLSVLSVIAIVFVCGGFGVFALASAWLSDLPSFQSASSFNIAMPTVVYANDRETELARFQLEYREPVEMEQISPLVTSATIATEDIRFYEHNGVDVMGVVRALINNFTGGQLEGASTITQQFVRNTILADEMGQISLKRKTREAYIALQLEKYYSKDEILLMYLNTINYGSGAYGIEAASQRYLSKHASELTLPEAALLASIPQSPTYNDPLLYPEHALERRNLVLSRMFSNGYISEQEYEQAKATPMALDPKELQGDGILAYPYFASYVRYLLYNDYDLSEADILRGGLSVYTTLDIPKQEAAEAAAATKLDTLNDSMEVAVAVVEPSTGYVQAIVGGSDYYASQVNLATGQGGYGRPCGSVFKTFTLVTAIKKGINPNSTYVDCTSPATVDGYTLENYGNASYGTRTIAGAFAISSNTGFVRLCASVGATEVAKTAYDLGVTSNLYEDDAYNSLTLGVQNVTPLEIANAFATIANGGVRHDVCAITEIVSPDGTVLVDDADPESRAERVISPEIAHAAQEVMKGVITSGTGTAALLPSGQPAAGKTGTSENYKDITFAGCTPQLAMAIWIGDPSNEASVPTGTAADVFRWYATDVLEGEEVRDFDWAEDPEYEPWDDKDHHVTTGYADWRSERGKKADEAEKAISEYKAGSLKEGDLSGMYEGLNVETTYEYSDKYEEGVVISQSIDTSTYTVYVTVSKGKDPSAKKEESQKEQSQSSSSSTKPSSGETNSGGSSGGGASGGNGGTSSGGSAGGGSSGGGTSSGGSASGGSAGGGTSSGGSAGGGTSGNAGGGTSGSGGNAGGGTSAASGAAASSGSTSNGTSAGSGTSSTKK